MGNSPRLMSNEFGRTSASLNQNSLPNRQSNAKNFCHASLLFRGLDKKLVDAFLKTGLSRRFLPGQLISRQGEPATNLHMIISGMVKIYGCTSSGLDALFDWCHPGDVVGLGALISPPPLYVWSTEATEQTETLTWDFNSTKVLGSRKEILYENALSIAIHWAESLQGRFQELATEKVEQRMAHLVLYLSMQLRERNDGTLDLHISNEDLAQMAGTNPYTINRILNQWERNGYIEKGRKRLRICDEQTISLISSQGTEADNPS